MIYVANTRGWAKDRGWTRPNQNDLAAKPRFPYLNRIFGRRISVKMAFPEIAGSLAGMSGRAESQASQNRARVHPTLSAIHCRRRFENRIASSIGFAKSRCGLPASCVSGATVGASLLCGANRDDLMPEVGGIVQWFCTSASPLSPCHDSGPTCLHRTGQSVTTNCRFGPCKLAMRVDSPLLT
jgi:hypothetical protein